MILIFEGAGCVERGDVENCRIRTRLKNNKGELIYIEITGTEIAKHSPNYLKSFKNAAIVDYCFIDNCNDKSKYRELERKYFEYTKENIIKFINENLNCNFTDIYITDIFDGYRVHGDNNTYNLMNDFVINKKRTAARVEAYNKIDKYFREKLNSKYSVIGLLEMNDNSITIRCHASKEVLAKAGLTDNDREKTIIINY